MNEQHDSEDLDRTAPMQPPYLIDSDFSFQLSRSELEDSQNAEPFAKTSASKLPEEHSQTDGTSFGRLPFFIDEFEIRRELGRGGFGCVYAGYDTVLHRTVAVKIPRIQGQSLEKVVAAYLHEARAIAALDHPCILPVYRAASSVVVPFYIVTKWIDGCDLAEWALQSKPSYLQISAMISKIANALAFAHERNVIHRDVKPRNVLVDRESKPYLADFGLALTNPDLRDVECYVGTIPYMSPEQARGEGHRVDGRSDIFSLGVVLYQLMTGKRPFDKLDMHQMLMSIRNDEPEHPRRVNPAIPKELARICLRAMAKHKIERYPTADAFASDLREFLKSEEVSDKVFDFDSTMERQAMRPDVGASPAEQSESTVRVVPKGLRPFDTTDSEFFLQLLPGPYDRMGVPERIRFWKSKIENRQPQQSCHVGVIYGPSGCGKTSMLRAGLLPRLSSDVIPIYIEASPEHTEQHLLSALRSTIDHLSHEGTETRKVKLESAEQIVDAFRWIRRHSKKKVLICIDQFEQWLLSHAATIEREPLTEAMRQCDGEFLQCLLLVRDDFWMGVTRLMQALEIQISEVHNAASVDLFDIKHSRHVLALFGQAYGKLPAEQENFTVRENRFLDAAIEYLASDGRVICVQLALLSEMMKQREWNESTIFSKDRGAGLGVRFLESTFDSEFASRRIHRHAEGAQRVLRLLLPKQGVKIKGAIHSIAELQSAASYSDYDNFQELLRILDSELHLITPSDRRDDESFSSLSIEHSRASSIDVGFQLTHDFLVAPIRRWLELRQLGSRTGQAQIRLEEFADLYRARPNLHSLPTLIEYATIRWRLKPNNWTEPQFKMMKAAGSLHRSRLARWLVGAAISMMAIAFAWRLVAQKQAFRFATFQVERLLDSNLQDAIEQSQELRRSDPSTQEILRRRMMDPKLAATKQMRAALALSPATEETRSTLWSSLEHLSPREVVQLAEAVPLTDMSSREAFVNQWRALGPKESFKQLVFGTLAVHDSQLRDTAQLETDRFIPHLLNENPMLLSDWMLGFKPLGGIIFDKLVSSFDAIQSQGNGPIVNASNLIVNYGSAQPEILAKLIAQAKPVAFPILLSGLKSHHQGLHSIESLLQESRRRAPSRSWIDTRGADWWNRSLDVSKSNKAISQAQATAQTQAQTIDHVQDSLLKLEGLQSIVEQTVLDDHFALCHLATTEQLDALSGALAKYGYRISSSSSAGSVEDATSNIGRLWMGLWKRDGRTARSVRDFDANQIREANDRFVAEGYFLDDLQAYSNDDFASILYSAVWTDCSPMPHVVETWLYIDVPETQHQSDGWQPFNDRGFIPHCDWLCVVRGKADAFSSIRWRLSEGYRYADKWNESSAWWDSVRIWSPGSVLLHQRKSARPIERADREMTTLCWCSIPLESQWLSYQPQDSHRLRSLELREKGFRPVNIHATQLSVGKEMQFSSVWWRPLPDPFEQIRTAENQARLILAALELGNSEPAMATFAGDQASELRAELIDTFATYQRPLTWLVSQLRSSENNSLRRAIAFALSLYPSHMQSSSSRNELTEAIQQAVPGVSDSGLRSAIDAVCRAWDFAAPNWGNQTSENEVYAADGQRLIKIHPTTPVWIGSPNNELGRDDAHERLVSVHLKNRYAIGVHELTVEKYLAFHPSIDYPEDYANSKDMPMIATTLFDAMRYCRWLSEKEDVPESEMCYPPLDAIRSGMTLPNDFLDRTGYRLPTQAEWEFAARGGSRESRHFGFAPELLGSYAWTPSNSGYRSKPVGLKLPNDYGLFDMLGNAMEWCQDIEQGNPWPMESMAEDAGRSVRKIEGGDRIATRGGAILFQPLDARSAHHDDHKAGESRPYLGFRIARTIRE